MRCHSAEQALSLIQNDETIWCHSMAATPYAMLASLAKVALDKQNLTLLSLHTEHSDVLAAAELQGHLRQRVFFVGRPSPSCGQCRTLPTMFRLFYRKFLSYSAAANKSLIPPLFRCHHPINMAYAAWVFQWKPPELHCNRRKKSSRRSTLICRALTATPLCI